MTISTSAKNAPERVRRYPARAVLRFARLGLMFVAAMCSQTFAHAQSGFAGGLPGALSPALLQQLSTMSPEQAQILARQYGIDLSAYGVGDLTGGSGGLATRGVPIQPASAGTASSSFEDLLQRARLRGDLSDEDAAERIEALEPSARFGLDFFRAEVSTFSPVDNVPVPSDYVLGPGDSVDVYFVGREARQTYLEVDRAGDVIIPELGRVAVAGLTFDQASKLIRQRVANELIGVEVLVGVGRLRAINVMLAGEVRVPGARALSAFSRVTHALFAAGGVSDIGSLRRIAVKRGGETVATFDAYELLLAGNAANDVQLRDGDVVFVPPVKSMAAVSGLVRRPAVYEIVSDSSLADLLEMGGGLTARALSRSAQLERQNPLGVPEIQPIELSDASLRAIAVRGGDHLRVLEAADRFANRLTLRGAVQRPGVYGYRVGMRVSDLVGDAAADLATEVDYQYALIVSTDLASGEVDVRQFSPADMLAGKGTDSDPELRPRDEVLLFFNTAASAIQAIKNRADELGEDADPEASPVEGEDMARDQSEAAVDDRAESLAASDGGNVGSPVDGMQLELGFAELQALELQRLIESQRRDRERPVARQELLEPVIARLEAQASPSAPVRVVTVDGAVHAPGNYPLGVKDTVSDLLAAAGGLRGEAFTRELELQRVVLDSEGVAGIRSFRISGEEVGSLGLGFQLESRDRLMVRAVPDWRPEDVVSVSGEVRFPGEYRIAPGETVGELLQRVGGLTPNGFASGAVFTRASVAEREERETERFIRELRRSAAASTLTLEASSVDIAGIEELVSSLRELPTRGRMVVDLPRVLQGDPSADLVLQDGDEILVPPLTRSVTVVGEVQHPGTFRFQESFRYEDYLALGAGVTRRADVKRMYVLHANGEISRLGGRSWWRFELGDQSIRPGDTIIVPINTSYRDTLEYWKSITQIVYQTGIAVAAILQLTND